MLHGRPLYDNAADARFYVTPSAWETVTRAVSRQLNVMIVGRRGVGKTSLLYQLQYALRRSEDNPVFVDGTAVESPMSLAVRLRDALIGRPSLAASRPWTEPWSVLAGDPAPPVAGASRAYYDVLTSLSQAPAAIVLLDASASADAVYEIFGRMRDTMWQLPHTWVLAVDDDDRATALKAPADAFFDTIVPLEPMGTNDLADLLARRAPEASSGMLARVAGGADGNPRAALRALGNAEITDQTPEEHLAARARLLEQASAMGRPHGMLMAELLDRDQASPSDEALQRSLGLTRARLTTLLRDLLAAELVIAQVERPGGPGRPRTVYRPALDR